MNYEHDRKLLRSGDVADENLHFSVLPAVAKTAAVVEVQSTGRRSKHSTRTTGLGTNRWTGPTTQTNSWISPNGVRLCYRVQGPREATPLLLVAGWDQDLTSWPALFIDALLERGFRVIRHDNRDAGRSSRIQTPPPSTLRQFRERPRRDAYNLQDMADDAVALLNHLGLERVHVLGISMGGMIAQSMAASHPDRVQTLTSLISTTGQSKIGQPAWSTKLRIARPAGPHPRRVCAPTSGPDRTPCRARLPARRGRRDPVRRGRLGPCRGRSEALLAQAAPGRSKRSSPPATAPSSYAGSQHLPSSSTATAI